MEGKKKMKKKIFYIILVCIIIAGAEIIGTQGLEVDIVYSKNVRIDMYLGKEYNHNEVEQIAKEIFNTNRVIVQQIEYFGDMFSLIISQDVENIDEKVEEFATKINETYELAEEDTNIQVIYQPKIKLSSILIPYLLPIAISMAIILIYVIIRFRKIGILKTLALYILTVLISEAVYLSVLAIFRIPINRLVTPIGLAIYVIVVTIVTAINEKKLVSHQAEKTKK